MSASPTSFRLFTSPDVCEGTPVALGRSHASWFLVYARPAGMVMKRLHMCLNFVVPGDASTVSAVSPDSGQPCFTVGGSRGKEVMDALLALRDENGRAPVKVVKEYPADDPYQLRAVVQVEVPDKELIHACARCGRWEAIFGARFLRCGMCRSRSYCSKQVRVHVSLSTCSDRVKASFSVPKTRLEASIPQRRVCSTQGGQGFRS